MLRPVDESPTPGAQRGEHDPCAYLNEPFDVVGTASTDEWSQRYEMQFNGEEKFLRQEVRRLPSNEMWYQEENVYKDGVKYVRNSTPENPDTLGEWWSAGTGFSGRAELPCLEKPSAGDSGAYRATSASSSDEPDYRRHETISDEEGSRLEEIWVDEAGRPTRMRTTFYATDELLPPPDSTTSGPTHDALPTPTPAPRFEYVFSGFGEPNVITAPALPTPTPRTSN